MRILTLVLFVGMLSNVGIVRADDAQEMDRAIKDLNAIGEKPQSRLSLYAVVSFQTNVPVGKLMDDRATNGLSYGELLVAESLAVATAKPVQAIVEQMQKNQSWTHLAIENRIAPRSLTARLVAAVRTMQTMETAERQTQPQRKLIDYHTGTKIPGSQRGYGFNSRDPMSPKKP